MRRGEGCRQKRGHPMGRGTAKKTDGMVRESQKVRESGESSVWNRGRNFKNEVVRTCYGKLKQDKASEMSLGLATWKTLEMFVRAAKVALVGAEASSECAEEEEVIGEDN